MLVAHPARASTAHAVAAHFHQRTHLPRLLVTPAVYQRTARSPQLVERDRPQPHHQNPPARAAGVGAVARWVWTPFVYTVRRT